MTWVASAGAYLGAHLLLYVLILRERPGFGRERTVFLYHALSAPLLAVATGVAWPDRWVATVVGAVALHGIYSLSFLELWSLAEGGYSVMILRRVQALPAGAGPDDLAGLRRVGAGKKASRIAGLEALGLIERRAEHIGLTARGRAVATLLATVGALANVRKAG